MRSETNDNTNRNRIEVDLSQNQDYNSLVDDLFPEENLMSDKLTREEKKSYDGLRDQIMKRETSMNQLSDLDKLLCERIPSSDTILKPTKSKAGKKPRKASHSESTKDDFFQKLSVEECKESFSTFTPKTNKRELKDESKIQDPEPFNFIPDFNDD